MFKSENIKGWAHPDTHSLLALTMWNVKSYNALCFEHSTLSSCICCMKPSPCNASTLPVCKALPTVNKQGMGHPALYSITMRSAHYSNFLEGAYSICKQPAALPRPLSIPVARQSRAMSPQAGTSSACFGVTCTTQGIIPNPHGTCGLACIHREQQNKLQCAVQLS